MTKNEMYQVANQARELTEVLRTKAGDFTRDQAVQLVSGAMPAIIEDVMRPQPLMVAEKAVPWMGGA